ncbi:MAG TPA: hypothetical protein VGO52_20105 [Hyphomonadaceae bacterium]|jgi:hypothetical protein|nr:hypothetical protein [Hyphomonadaceae bacterium]
MKILSILLFATLLCAEASAQALWQNVSVGMTSAEVSAAQPSAKPATKPDSLASGATCDLQIASTPIDAADYRVCFFFKNEKLTQVTLGALGTPSKGQFDGIVTLLRAKYGPELSQGPDSLGYRAEWKVSDAVNVSVIYIDKVGRLMNIVYQTRLADERNKL